MILYRGLRDILPNQVKLDVTMDGMYGEGVYLTKSKRVAMWYGGKNFDIFGIIITYSLNCAYLTVIEGIHFKSKDNTILHNSKITLTKHGRELFHSDKKDFIASDLLSLARNIGIRAIEVKVSNFCENTVLVSDYSCVDFMSYSLFLDKYEEIENPSLEFAVKAINEREEMYGEF